MLKNPTHPKPPLPSIPLSPCLLQQNFCFLLHYRTSLLSPSNSQRDLGHSQDELNSIGKGKYYYSSFKSKMKRERGLRYCFYSLERNELKPLIMGFSDLYQEGLGICKKKIHITLIAHESRFSCLCQLIQLLLSGRKAEEWLCLAERNLPPLRTFVNRCRCQKCSY